MLFQNCPLVDKLTGFGVTHAYPRIRICSYCGRQSDDGVQYCAECGQTLTATKSAKRVPAAVATRAAPQSAISGTLNARSAGIIFLCSFGVQFFLGVLSGILRGTGNALAAQHRSEGFTAAAVWIELMIPVTSGVAMMAVSARLARKNLRDTTPEGAAWVVGSNLSIATGVLVGLLVGTAAHFFGKLIGLVINPHVPLQDLLLSNGAAFGTGMQLFVSLVTRSLAAPAFEELEARGIIYGGFRKSFGSKWATALSTAIFLAGHIPLSIKYPTVTICLIALSSAALWIRLKSKAIGAAIAVHVGYNLVLSLDSIASKLIGAF